MNLDNLMSKHLTRYFDSSKTIPAESLQQLLRFLRTVPSSVNVQASRYYVLGTPEGKERLAGNLGERFLDNGGKIRDASHVLVFTTRSTCPIATSKRCSARKPMAGSRTPRSSRGGNQ